MLLGLAEFNVGQQGDFRVPDGGWVPEDTNLMQPLDEAGRAYLPTATVLLEVLSPKDESYEKFGFYAARGISEVLVAHPTERSVQCWHLHAETAPVEQPFSPALDVHMETLGGMIRWP